MIRGGVFFLLPGKRIKHIREEGKRKDERSNIPCSFEREKDRTSPYSSYEY